MDGYGKLFEDIKAGKILSAYAVEGRGAAEAVSKMAFGNKMGVKIEHNVDPRDFFGAGWGNIVCEVAEGKVGELSIPYTLLGEVTDKGVFEYGNTTITMDEALASWMKTLEDVFPTVTIQILFTSATTSWHSRKYLSLYSLVLTASTTAQKPLNVQAQR